MMSERKMHRWSGTHPLDVYVPVGELDYFVLYMPVSPPVAKSSVGVEIERFRRDDGWALKFSLKYPRFRAMFQALYDDVFKETWNVTPESSGRVFIDIYNRWRDAFTFEKSHLTQVEIKGLIGEMVTIRDVLLKAYSPNTVLDSWMLLHRGEQDFIASDFWYEVKATDPRATSVGVSSIEQLDDVSRSGMLVVVRLKTTSSEDPEHVTVNSIIKELYQMLSGSGCSEKFLGMMHELGLPSDEFDNQCFSVSGVELYNVDDSFPCLRRQSIPESVTKVEYQLNLGVISSYRVS